MLKQVKFKMFALYNQSLSLLLHTKTSKLTHKPVSISRSECEGFYLLLYSIALRTLSRSPIA